MSDSSQHLLQICQIFHFDVDRIESCTCISRQDSLILDIKLKDQRNTCPQCGNSIVKIKGYVLKKINNSILSNQNCQIHYHARRYQCPVCGRTYYEENPFVFKSMKISFHVVLAAMKDLTKPSETFTSVAERYDLSGTTVASLFDDIVSIPRAQLPEILSIDENYAFHSKEENSKYICVLLDQETGRPIDLLPSRRFEYLDAYFKKIPQYEKDRVRFVVTDMYEPYRRIQKKHFPTSIHIIDHYHIAQEMHRRMDAVRLRILRSYRCINKKHRTQEQNDAYYLLKHQNHLLFRHFSKAKGKDKKLLFDVNRERTYNAYFKKYMNPYDLAMKLIGIHPDINTAWAMKDAFRDFYQNNTIESAPEALKNLMEQMRGCGIEELMKFSYTLYNWKEEILNSFHISYVEYHVSKATGKTYIKSKKITNSLIEQKNSVIKLIKKASNGYGNWERFRNRCLLVLENIDFEVDPKDGRVKMVAKKEPGSQ